MGSSVNNIVVGAALVGEALTVAVDLQEGLSAGVVLADGAGEGLAAESGVACHITAVHAGSHDAAVEQHGSSFLVEVCTGPDSGTDAVALIGRRVGAGGGDGGTQRVQLLHHVGVAGEAAAGQQNALVGVVADEVVILGALGDDAGDAAGGVLLQLCQRGLEVHIVAQLTGCSPAAARCGACQRQTRWPCSCAPARGRGNRCCARRSRQAMLPPRRK